MPLLQAQFLSRRRGIVQDTTRAKMLVARTCSAEASDVGRG